MKHSTLAVRMALTADPQPPLTDETVDVSEFAQAFFKVPVLFSRDVWELCIAMRHIDAFRQPFRIKSLLVQSKIAIRHAAAPHLTEASFEVRLRRLDSNSGPERHRILAKAVAIDGVPGLLLQLYETSLAEVAS